MIKNDIEEKFLVILRSALWGQKIDSSLIGNDEYDDVIRLSYDQAVAGVVLNLCTSIISLFDKKLYIKQ